MKLGPLTPLKHSYYCRNVFWKAKFIRRFNRSEKHLVLVILFFCSQVRHKNSGLLTMLVKAPEVSHDFMIFFQRARRWKSNRDGDGVWASFRLGSRKIKWRYYIWTQVCKLQYTTPFISVASASVGCPPLSLCVYATGYQIWASLLIILYVSRLWVGSLKLSPN